MSVNQSVFQFYGFFFLQDVQEISARKSLQPLYIIYVLTPRREGEGECILQDVKFGTMEVKKWSFIFFLLLILEFIVVFYSDGLNLEKWFPRRSLHRMHVCAKEEHDSQ